MKKLAVFVEGHTEVLLMQRLIEEIAGANKVRIEHREIRGGNKARRSMALITAAKPDTGQNYFVMIFDCGGDDPVKTRILEEHQNLTINAYTKIIGIRDVRPKYTYADIPKLEAGLNKYVKTALIPVIFILAVMEIEAWFLSEHNHFPLIHPSITVSAIKANLGFNPEQDDMTQRPTPTDDLIACYGIGGMTYEKNKAETTVAVLDYPFFYLELPKKIGYLNRLIDGLDEFLA